MSMNENAIRDKLVGKGRSLFDAPREQLIVCSGVPEADTLLNDFTAYPHAFVLACLMDRRVDYKIAWLVPYKISQKIGDFSIDRLLHVSHEELREHFDGLKLPYPEKMCGVFYSAIQRIVSEYAGDASRIWANEPSSAEAVYRFLQFNGAGPKIATMAVNILARDFKIKFADYCSVDVSTDVHVCRVFERLGLCTSEPDHVRYKARALYPDFPGMIDLPCWEIGKNWCRPKNPKCDSCYMNDVCPSVNSH
jgi:endonuclease III